MADELKWDDETMTRLRDLTQTAHDSLREAGILFLKLKGEMESDGSWQGLHKESFMAWMRLLMQFHFKIQDHSIGPSAVEALDQFLANWLSYYENSNLQYRIRGIG